MEENMSASESDAPQTNGSKTASFSYNANQNAGEDALTNDSSEDSTSSSPELGDNVSSNEENSSRNEQCVPQDVTDFTEVSELDEDIASASENATENSESDCSNNKSNQRVYKLPNIDFSSDWFNHDCFKGFWNHYAHCMSWFKKHYETVNKLQSEQYQIQCQNYWRQWSNASTSVFNQYSYHPYIGRAGTSLSANTVFKGSQNSLSSNDSVTRHKRRRGGRKQKKRRKQSEASDSTGTSQAKTESEFEMEITQDMIDFFAKSDEHRRLREEEKTRTESGEEIEHINVEQVKAGKDKVPTVKAPTERPGSRRTAEMKMLYGKGAAMIHGMETAVQMTFDRNTDICQPKYWPNMPLKVVFG